MWPGRTTASARTPTSAPQSLPSALRRAPADWTASARGERIGVMMKFIFIMITFYRKASGECVGWKCVCKSSDNTLPPEFEDIKASE